MNTKAKSLLISFCLVSFYSLCQNTFIPDDNFEQALIDLGLDSPPLNNSVLTSNISNITDLEITSRNITDLTGIEDFVGLTNLDCSDNQLTALNVSQNINLIELYCSENQLTNLDVSTHSNLVRLWCFDNQLSSLNVSVNPDLISLRCENNLLINLDTSNNPNLTVLVCERNQLSIIDVSSSLGLQRIQCGNNRLSSLDIKVNTSLSYLSCEQNQITNLNTSDNSQLAFLYCFNNQITTLNFLRNPNLTDLNCRNNQLCALNIKNGNNNNITAINFDMNPDLDCVVVDNSSDGRSSWIPTSFSNYVNSAEACRDFIPVDSLENIIGTSFILPPLTNGNYFTESNGLGRALNAGTVINTTQTIYIFNETTCNNNESQFVVYINNGDYFIPKYFTPNNDGTNDVWQIYDRLNLINNISIYNRHGKLIKFLPNSASVWDGTFNGELLSSDSYWYEIILTSRKVLHGHFALKR